MKSLWLAALTIRESIVKGTLVFYFAVGNLIIILFAFAVGSTVVDGATIITMFGNPIAPPSIAGVNGVQFILLQLFQSSTGALTLFGVAATAGLIPAMLEKGTVELYLSKPLSRPSIFLARSFGACAGIGVNLLYFAVSIWFVFGIKTGVWHSGFLLAVSMAIVAYFLYFSVVALTSVVSRSTGFAIMIALVYTLFSTALEHREQALFVLWDNVVYHRVLDGLYYCTPQLSGMMDSAAYLIGPPMRARMAIETMPAFTIMPFVYSFLSAAAIYGAATWYFSRQDY